MAEVIRHAEECGAPGELFEELKRLYAAGGRTAVVNHTISRLESAAYSSPALHLAILYGDIGDLDAAFHH